MSYSVANTVGTVVATVLDGQKDTSSSSLVFIGKSVINYGEIQNENFLWLLENFSGPSEPAQPQEGQIWWDNVNKNMFVYIVGIGWKPLSSFISNSVAPLNAYSGDQWWDTVNQQLKIWVGTEWALVGPAYSVVDGKTGALVENVFDNSATKHTITKIYSAGTVLATISKYAEFTPNVAVTGFSTIKPGIQLSSTLSNIKVQGTATNSDALGGIPAANYFRNNADNDGTGNLRVRNSLFTVGANSELAVVVGSSGELVIDHRTADSFAFFRSNVGGTLTTVLTMDGQAGRISTSDPVNNENVATKGYVDGRDLSYSVSLTNAFNSALDIRSKNYQFTSANTRYQPTVYVGSDAPNNAVGTNGDIWIRFY